MKINPFAPNMNVEPAEKYAEEKRAWQGAPSIVRTKGGRLLVGFMSGGIYEPDPRNCCLLVYSDDQGESWSAPVLAIESRPDVRQRVFEIELWIAPTGALWLFWAETPYEAGLAMPDYTQKIDMENDSEYHRLEAQVQTWCAVCEDPDAQELVFGEPWWLFNAVNRNHPFVTKSGRWLFPTYLASPRDYYQFYYSDDGGKTVKKTEPRTGRPGGRNYDEPSFYQLKDGRIAALMRTTHEGMLRMFSSDEGLTWSEPEFFMEVASQRPCSGNDHEGGVWLIPSIHPKNRNGLRLMYSADGLEFEDRLSLDDRARISYPEFVWDPDGTMYVTYDRERNNKINKSWVTGLSESAKEILFARIPADVLQSGEITSETVRARIITKAKINELDNYLSREK